MQIHFWENSSLVKSQGFEKLDIFFVHFWISQTLLPNKKILEIDIIFKVT
jgi:hypothetical protein